MSYITESRKPGVSRQVMELLGEAPGPVDGLYLFCVMGCIGHEGIFKCLHLARTLLTGEFEFVINHSSEAKLFVRPKNSVDDEILEDASTRTYQHDYRRVKILKIHELKLIPAAEDVLMGIQVRTFPASYDDLPYQQMVVLGYPVGKSNVSDDIEKFQNPEMSRTTMSILGISEGVQEGLLNIVIKRIRTAEALCHAVKVIPFHSGYKFAVDQDGSMFIKFDDVTHALATSSKHYLINNHMIKFYFVSTVRKVSYHLDQAKKTVCSRLSKNTEDHFEPI